MKRWKQAVIAWMSEYAGWSAEQERQYTTELDAYLYEAVTPVEVEAEASAVKAI